MTSTDKITLPKDHEDHTVCPDCKFFYSTRSRGEVTCPGCGTRFLKEVALYKNLGLLEPISMTDGEVEDEIQSLKEAIGVGEPCCRLDVDGHPESSGRRGDLLALRTLKAYLDRRNA